MHRSKLWMGIASFAASLAISLLAAEVCVRVLRKHDMVLFPRYHTDTQYGPYTLRAIRPNSVFRHTSPDGRWEFRTNAKGQRNDTNFDYEKPPGTRRIICVGDSNTQGYEVDQEDTYSAVLARYLNRHDPPAQVLNAGISGFSTAEALVYVEQEGIRYHPDAVVLGFYANDMEDNIKTGLFGLGQDASLQALSHAYVPGVRIQNLIYALPGIPWLSEHSYLYSLAFNAIWDFQKRARFKKTAAQVMEYALPTQSNFSDYQVQLAAELINRMDRFSTEHGVRFYLLDIPIYRQDAPPTSSLTPELTRRLTVAPDRIVNSIPLLDEYYGVVELHRPHGHHHIAEFSHALLGAELGRRIRHDLSVSRERVP